MSDNNGSGTGGIDEIAAQKQAKRTVLKQTVERAIPDELQDIDTTKVLTDEEVARLSERTQELQTDRAAAQEHGREGLRARLKNACLQNAQVAKRLTIRVKP